MSVAEMSVGALALQVLATAVVGVVCYYLTEAMGKRHLAGLVKIATVILSASHALLLVTKTVLAVRDFFAPALQWLERWGG